ncbi:MAG: NAD-dependent epimerase/dehydratase family protein [Flavobacteriaceae bacterium]|nr:MAG: NAD-dependent epimerase/dehydratase family protein [Flavobacteriaceae bacterium]
MKKKSALVLGAGGFIGSHMVKRLKHEDYWVRGVDLKYPEYSGNIADEFLIEDLRNPFRIKEILAYESKKGKQVFDDIYQFAADMGGAAYIFTGDNDADIMHNSVVINLNILNGQKELSRIHQKNNTTIFYSSSACIYPQQNQMDPARPNCAEDTAYPAHPDSEYGWEKIFSERLYLTYARNYKIPVRIAQYHNIFGPEGTWKDGKEKVPAAICRKIGLLPKEGGTIEIWGDGHQTRSFLFIDECIEATRKLMNSDFQGPVNIGSEEKVSIRELVRIVAKIAGKKIVIKPVLNGPVGVKGRNSNNDLIREKLQWDYTQTLEEGIRKTYDWIIQQIDSVTKPLWPSSP